MRRNVKGNDSRSGRRLTMLGRLGYAAVMVLVLGTGAGCAVVKPWERGTLADYTMRPDRDPLGDVLSEHMYFSREAASGGRGVGGGGCGCN